MDQLSYSFSTERYVPEETSKVDSLLPTQEKIQLRSPFAKDRARVLHSAALRRLADKTQVVSPRKNWNPRTRLTHSLEVGQIAREIALSVGLDPDLAEMAGLAHDIGHPPFGHNGEKVLNELASTFGGFESNAQNLRILTNLEPKILTTEGVSAGLNLTRAALDATMKYPWTRTATGDKFGVYQTELPVFNWIRLKNSSKLPSPIAQVMEWADDIAYSVHDVEDGTIAGRINLQELASSTDRKDLAALAIEYGLGTDTNELIEAAKRLSASSVVQKVYNYDGSLMASINLKRFTSFFVSRFCNAVVSSLAKDAPFREINISPSIKSEVNMLKALALKYISSDPQHIAEQKVQRELIIAVYEYLWSQVPHSLDPILLANWQSADSDLERKRLVVDQIASMTEGQISSIIYTS